MKVDIPTLEEIKVALVKDFKRQTRLLMQAMASPAWKVKLPRPRSNEKKATPGHPISRTQRAAMARGMKRYWTRRRRTERQKARRLRLHTTRRKPR